jgi:hypothetical protein
LGQILIDMTTIFYLLTILFIFFEITRFNRIEKIRLALDTIGKKKKEDPESELDEESIKNLKTNGCFYASVALLYLIWSFIGLALSSHWYLFGILLLIGIFTSILRKIISLVRKSDYYWLSRLNSFLSSLVLVSVFFAHFHPEIFNNFIKMFFNLRIFW